MKSRFGKIRLGYVIFVFAILFGVGILGCSNEAENGTNNGNQTEKPEDKTQKEPEKPAIICDSFFWGTWVRMDNGTEYEVLESSIVQGNKNYAVTASDENSLTVNSIGTFKKESDSVIICDNIPYFRKGGANLEYTLKIVGFTSSGAATSSISEISSAISSLSARAAGTEVKGIKGKGKSTKYKNFEIDSESNENGIITFTAPTTNDPQTVELITDDDEIIIISGLEISNDGDNMGTVALVGKDDYNLKITGKISDDQKNGGYLFGNNAKTYEMEITITNVSENKCSSSGCTIKSADKKLSINSSVNLEGFPITTLVPHATKTVSVELTYGELSEPYVDTGLIITIENPLTNQTWEDYIPLRFFKGTIPITIAAKNPENNNNAALNGFVIYPDGNNQFFAIKHNDYKPIFVPTFGSEKTYKLVFSGATVTSQLSDSTEMFYTIEPASITPRTVITEGIDAIRTYMTFGGNNHSENNAYSVTEGFEAYLNEGEIDYYSICADSDEFYGPEGRTIYRINYENEKGDVPKSFLMMEGKTFNSSHLPEIKCVGYEFLGWYDGERRVEAGSYCVQDNLTLSAKWKLENYPIVYNLNGGINNVNNPTTYTVENDVILLAEPNREGYDFKGWFVSSDFSGKAVESIDVSFANEIILYAQWSVIVYHITYEYNGGISDENYYTSYTIETKTIILGEPKSKDFLFGGWYEEKDFSGEKITKIEKGCYGDKILYAKWLRKCTVTYESLYGIVPDSIIVGEGETLSSLQLPELISNNYFFCGWYINEINVSSGYYVVTDDIILRAQWVEKYTVSYNSSHGITPAIIYVKSGSMLTNEQLPELKERGWKFKGWYIDNGNTEISNGYTITNNIILYAKWEKSTVKELTNEIEILPLGTDGTAGKSALYVLFGDWPQTIKSADVIIDESINEIHGVFTYYSGSDGYWYVKCQERAMGYDVKYSDGTIATPFKSTLDPISMKYFKVEPIKWRVLTNNYNNTDNALLLAENILFSWQYYRDYNEERLIEDSIVYPNNYKESEIRAYLNGLPYYFQNALNPLKIDNSYNNNGFLQSAFTSDAQNRIIITNVNNGDESINGTKEYLNQAIRYVCKNTNDKIFLLSRKEVTTLDYGFASFNENDSTRIRFPTDYAIANYTASFGQWWLRSPSKDNDKTCTISSNGKKSEYRVTYSFIGIVPALTISLPEE